MDIGPGIAELLRNQTARGQYIVPESWTRFHPLTVGELSNISVDCSRPNFTVIIRDLLKWPWKDVVGGVKAIHPWITHSIVHLQQQQQPAGDRDDTVTVLDFSSCLLKYYTVVKLRLLPGGGNSNISVGEKTLWSWLWTMPHSLPLSLRTSPVSAG
jgi:hypothetical protein